MRPARNAAATSVPPTASGVTRRRARAGRAPSTAATRPLETVEPDTARSANARSRADWKRSSGCFSRQWQMMRSMPAARPTPPVARADPADPRAGSPPSFRRGPAMERATPVTISYSTQPSAKMSDALIDGLPAHLLGRHVAHGAEHGAGIGLARRVGRIRFVRRARRTWRGQTEVQNLHAAVGGENMFSGLRSRWMIPRACAAARARARSRRRSRQLSAAAARHRASRSRSVSPSSSSITAYDTSAPSRAEVVDRQDVRDATAPRRPALRARTAPGVGIAARSDRQGLLSRRRGRALVSRAR